MHRYSVEEGQLKGYNDNILYIIGEIRKDGLRWNLKIKK